MSVTAEVRVSRQQFLSLYLDLDEGENADLVVVAQASLALASAIKEIAYIIDPGLEIGIDFASGTEGSLSLNTILKTLRRTTIPSHITLRTIALVVIGWLGNDLRTYGVTKFMDQLFSPEQRQSLSDDDIKKITDALQNTLEGKIAKAPMQHLYREIERDTAIKGIGATIVPGVKPSDIVPRQQFPERSGESIDEKQPQKRTRTTNERITLISPVLLPKDRAWKFYLPSIGEFGARIKDEKFLASLLAGRRRIPMRAGIQIDVELDTREEKSGNVWVVKDRSVKRVIRVQRARSFPDLFSSDQHERDK